jgi:hypothetical protein
MAVDGWRRRGGRVSYYPTIEEDLARAKEILGRVNDSYQFHPKDEGDASQLLESFVAEIERLQNEVKELKKSRRLSPGAFRHPTGFGT